MTFSRTAASFAMPNNALIMLPVALIPASAGPISDIMAPLSALFLLFLPHLTIECTTSSVKIYLDIDIILSIIVSRR